MKGMALLFLGGIPSNTGMSQGYNKSDGNKTCPCV